MSQLPLSELRVLDFSDEWGAYCTKLLADMGADVILVEPPGGGRMRTMAPLWGAERVSLQDVYYQANKKSVTLDVARPEAGAILRRLVGWSNVLVHSGGDVAAAIDAATRDINFPELITCAITGFGLTGPYRNMRSSNMIAHAMGGGMYILGPPEGPPPILRVNEFLDMTGVHAALAIVSAFRAVPHVGGQVIDISVQEVVASHDLVLHRYGTHQVVVKRKGNLSQTLLAAAYAVPSGCWQCRDGLAEFQVWSVDQWHAFRALLGDPPELSDSRLDETMYRGDHGDELRPVIAELLAERGAAELVADAQRLHVPSALVNQPGDLIRDPHARERGMFEEMEHRQIGHYQVARSPFRSDPAISTYRTPSASLGEDNQNVYVDALGFALGDIEQWQSEKLI
jgi:crotonobetainyl-CoA:carnitine CoA-transferase CaiB-like acyl-CoA transferase